MRRRKPPTYARFAGCRLLAYLWAAPNTALGMAMGLTMLCFGGQLQFLRGAAEFSGGLMGRLITALPASLRFDAMTLGHVILGVSQAEVSAARQHEHVHVRQYERWGIFFLPAYVLSSVWQIARGRRAYRDNFFERQAYGVEADQDLKRRS
jgi:hypothetical protein